MNDWMKESNVELNFHRHTLEDITIRLPSRFFGDASISRRNTKAAITSNGAQRISIPEE